MILLALLLVSAAADVDADLNCEDPGPQQEMNLCAVRDFEEADKALNAQWKIAVAAMKEQDEDSDIYDDGRPGFYKTLLEGQRAWLKYRDAHCPSEGYLFRGGSMEPFMVSTCMTRLTKMRTEELRLMVSVE